jgi:hypothetical protein
MRFNKLITVLLTTGCVLAASNAYADVTLSTVATPASNIEQGVNNHIVYICRVDVTGQPAVINNVQYTLSGTHDNNDLVMTTVWFNPTTPSLTGASFLSNDFANFAAPHAYNIFLGVVNIAAGGSGYFIITVNTEPAATSGNTIKLNGAANPVSFTYTGSPAVSNNQTDAAGALTILAAGVTISTVATIASSITQGSNNNIVYVCKVDVTAQPLRIFNMQFRLTGTHDNNDLVMTAVWFNATAPSLTGASFLSNGFADFAAPHLYNIFLGAVNIAPGSSGYFIVTVNTSAAATSGNTVVVNGAADPVSFTYGTSPTITNNQTNVAGTLTISAATVTLATIATPAINIAQGTNNHIAYICKMDVATQPVSVNNIQFTLAGTYDNNDLSNVAVWFNATAPSLTGASFLTNGTTGFAAPHAYNLFVGAVNIAAGASGYFIITINTDAAATGGSTVKIDGAANPGSFTYSNTPTITNNQTDAAGALTILTAGVTLSTIGTPASGIAQGSSNHIVYVCRMDVTAQPVAVNNIQFTLSGTHDNNDLTTTAVWFNATAPSLTGASFLTNSGAGFAAPHTYNLFVGSVNIAAGGSGYFIITVTTDAAATVGNAVRLNGAVNPVTFTFFTVPPVTNNQTDAAGSLTISNPLPLRLISFSGSVNGAAQIQLQWITAQETGTKDFGVEWSFDGTAFTRIGVVAAAGNSVQNRRYEYTHTGPQDGANYYRLKMTDEDGTFTYSPVCKVSRVAPDLGLKVFPNPFAATLHFLIRAEKNETVVYALYDAGGRKVREHSFNLNKGNNQLSWDLQQLPTGCYLLSCSGSGHKPVTIFKQ